MANYLDKHCQSPLSKCMSICLANRKIMFPETMFS